MEGWLFAFGAYYLAQIFLPLGVHFFQQVHHLAEHGRLEWTVLGRIIPLVVLLLVLADLLGLSKH